MGQVTESQPSSVPVIDFIAAWAVVAGWPHRAAFECAMLLVCHGTSAAEVEQMFRACRRWIQ
jgi:hypothetical protein